MKGYNLAACFFQEHTSAHSHSHAIYRHVMEDIQGQKSHKCENIVYLLQTVTKGTDQSFGYSALFFFTCKVKTFVNCAFPFSFVGAQVLFRL